MYKSKRNSHSQGRDWTTGKDRERKEVVKGGHFLCEKREIRAEKTEAGEAGRRADQLMNITELTHPVAWNA